MLGRFLQYLALGVVVKAIREPTSCGMAIRFAAVDSMFCSTVEVLVAPRMTCHVLTRLCRQIRAAVCVQPPGTYFHNRLEFSATMHPTLLPGRYQTIFKCRTNKIVYTQATTSNTVPELFSDPSSMTLLCSRGVFLRSRDSPHQQGIVSHAFAAVRSPRLSDSIQDRDSRWSPFLHSAQHVL